MSRILVSGATGHLGGATIKALLGVLPGRQLAALARDPDKAAHLKERGVEVRRGDFYEVDSLIKAFDGW
jgi:NAD(P)H dehydrogenase (quinone)